MVIRIDVEILDDMLNCVEGLARRTGKYVNKELRYKFSSQTLLTVLYYHRYIKLIFKTLKYKNMQFDCTKNYHDFYFLRF